jgi:bifunctional DNase/RNase
MEIDARPSDAIAISVRFGAPIYVADAILEQGMEE